MTMRLRDMQGLDDPDMAEATRLLRILAPSAPTQAFANRLYARIHARRASRLRLAGAGVFVCVLLASTAILSATVAHRWLPSAVKAPSPPAVAPPASPHPTRPAAAHTPAAPVQETGFAATAAAALAPSALSPNPRASRSTGYGPSRRRLAGAAESQTHAVSSDSEASTEARVAAAPPQEGALVLAALRTLRRERSPERAGILIDLYLGSFPRGVLIEEALAIGMEAALSGGDASSATRLATRYLQQYPNGRFAKLARKASSDSKP